MLKDYEIDKPVLETDRLIIRTLNEADEGVIQDSDEVAGKKWMPINEVKQLLKENGTKDGVSMLAILYTLEFYEL